MPDKPNAFEKTGGRAWSQEIETSVAALHVRLAMIRSRRTPLGVTSGEAVAICDGVAELLDRATTAARGKHPTYKRPLSWWRGTSIEASFRSVHLAESELAKLYTDMEVEAEVPAAIARSELALNRDDPLRNASRALAGMPPGARKRVLLSKMVQAGHEAADGAHARIRNLRNILVLTTLSMTVLVVAFSVLVATNPGFVPLCFRPDTPPGFVACPTGAGVSRDPASFDVVVVAVLGTLGGSLAAAVSIKNLRGTAMPYDIPIALALLKVPAGALTAIGALIAIRGDFVPGLSALDTQEQILAYALLFGYAQQLLTGLIDRRALGLLDTVPSKDAEQSRPPSAAVPAPPTMRGRRNWLGSVSVRPRTSPSEASNGASGTGVPGDAQAEGT
jgi:hypothetical protein